MSSLQLQFVSLDGSVYASATVRNPPGVVHTHAAILSRRVSAKAHVLLREGGPVQNWEGDLVRYQGPGFDAPRTASGSGHCQIYAFASSDDRDAFCKATQAIRAHYVRASVTSGRP